MESIRELNNLVIIKQNKPYNLTRKCAILRLLIIDGSSSLYSTINKDYSIKLNSKITSNYYHSHGISTFDESKSTCTIFKYFVEDRGEKCSIPNFLKKPSIKINNPQLIQYLSKQHISDNYNVSDVIKLVSNAHGGVHLANWGSDISNFIETSDDSPFNINSNSKLHSIVDNISEIVVEILRPLFNTVHKNLLITKPIVTEVSFIFPIKKDNEISS